MKCSFSGKEIPPGTGKMYVKKDGTILWFASSKEQKNMLKLGRKAQRVRWTESAKGMKSQRLAALAHEKEEQKEQKAESKDDSKTSSNAKSTKSSKKPVSKKAASKSSSKSGVSKK